MLRCHFQTTAYVAANQFFGVLFGGLVYFFIFALMQENVVSDTAADKTFLDSRQGVDAVVNIQNLTVVGIQVGKNLRINARGAFAFFANGMILTAHAIHVARRATQVGQIAFEIGHGYDLLYLFQYALFASANNKFSLMS